jgi:hypothetical protein
MRSYRNEAERIQEYTYPRWQSPSALLRFSVGLELETVLKSEAAATAIGERKTACNPVEHRMKKRNRVWEQLCAVLTASLCMTSISAFAASPSDLFQGFDSVVGEARLTALNGSASITNGLSSVEYQICTDSESLKSALGINQSGSATYGPFGGDEKISFLRQIESTKYSVSIVVRSQHISSVQTAISAKFNNDAQPIHPISFASHESQLRSFFAAYGDSYVNSVTKGGEYYAVYTFHTQNLLDQQSVSASVSGHAGWALLSASADLQTILNTLKTTAHSDWTFNQKVFGLKNPNLPSPDGAIAYALKFPSIDLDAPAVLSFETTGYEHVPKAGDLGQLAKNRTYFLGAEGLVGVSQNLTKLRDLQNQIQQIMSVEKFYGGPSDSKLFQADRQVGADISALDSQIRQFEVSPVDSFTMPSLPSLSLGTPKLSITYPVPYSACSSNPNGPDFDDVEEDSAAYQKQRIATLQVNAGSWIDHLAVTYERNGEVATPVVHGGPTGSSVGALQLLPGQFISRVVAKCWTGGPEPYVKHLEFYIADGSTHLNSGANYSENKGDPVTWDTPAGAVLVGFRGHTDQNYLSQLLPVYLKLGVASWQP